MLRVYIGGGVRRWTDTGKEEAGDIVVIVLPANVMISGVVGRSLNAHLISSFHLCSHCTQR